MRTSTVTAATAALAGVSTAQKTFDATSKTNVVTYWGQGAGQGELLDYCQNPNIDVINIGFVNVFPDQGSAGWPGTNFGNACGSETYTYNNITTELLSNCPDIGPDIVLCQQMYGTKILLSIGGAGANGYNDNNASAENFARFLWGAFGPSLAEWTDAGGPRPFGEAVVDGFDFDIESELSSAPVVNSTTITDYMTRGWVSMVSTFKDTLFAEDDSKSYYLSAAPQCVIPDEHLSIVIANAWFDFILVQFYDTASCSARAALSTDGFSSYTDWTEVSSFNPDAKVLMGLAASTASADEASYYLEPSEVNTLVSEVYTNDRFGGIMLWEASTEATNIICSRDYATWMKQILVANVNGTTIDTASDPCPAQTVSPDGTCGDYNGYTCVGSIFGNCCSTLGYCGDTSEYCAIATCNTDGGDCGLEYVGIISPNSTSSSTTSANSTIAGAVYETGTASVDVNAAYGASTQTIYSTEVVTVTSCAATVTDCPARTESQTLVTITSSYAVATTVVYYVQSAAASQTGATTSTSTGATSSYHSTVTVSSSTVVDAIYASASSSLSSVYSSSTGSYAQTNSTTTVSGNAATTVSAAVQIVTATVSPVHGQALYATPANSSVVGVASSTLSMAYNASTTAAAIYTGAASRAGYSLGGVVALAIGAYLTL